MIVPPKLSGRPEVSVIMGVKNGEKTLAAAIESLFAQDLKNWELVVVNDGSTDGTSKLLESFRQIDPERIQIISQDNQGLTKSLNTAIKASRGKYIARLDADDLNVPERFSKQLEVLRREKLDFVVARAFKVERPVPNPLLFFWMNSEYLKLDNAFVHGTFFGKREVFAQLMYDTDFRFAQDYDFINRLLKTSFRIGYIYKSLYVLGTGQEQISIKQAGEQFQMAKQIALKHHSTALIVRYWALNRNSHLRKLLKIVLSISGLVKSKKIKKIFF